MYSTIWAGLPPLYLLLSFFVFHAMLWTRVQMLRILWLPVFLGLSMSSLTATKYFWFSPQLASLWIQSVTLYILHIVSVLFIEKLPTPANPLFKSSSESVRSPQKVDVGWTSRLRITYKIWGNPRLYRVRTDASQLGEYPSIHVNADQQLHTFLFLRAIKLPIYYLLHVHVLPKIFAETIVDIMPSDVGPVEQTLFRRLGEFSAREAVVRAHTSVFWIWESFVLLDRANAVLSIFFVLVGFDEPSDWPALFGSVQTITSLRKFWSHFWHGLATRPYRNYGRVVAGRILRFESGSTQFNTTVSLTVFLLSGITHAITVWQFGFRDWHLEIQWFLLNFVGCLAERLFLSYVRAFAKRLAWSRELYEIENSWFGRLIGSVWVWGFFFWSVPAWKFPRLRKEAVFRQGYRDFMARLETFKSS